MDVLNRIIAIPWISFPLVTLAGGVSVYYLYPLLEAFFLKRAFGRREQMRKMLDEMFIIMEPEKFNRILLILNVVPPVLAFLLLWPKFQIGVPLALGVWLLFSQLPFWYIQSKWDQRADAFVGQMVDGLTIMANGIRAGLSVHQTMERVIETLPNPISQEFNLVLAQVRLGRSLEESLLELGERIPRADLQMFVTAINILKETGGNLAETFTTIVIVIRERQKLEQKIKTMTTQGKMQGLIISAVPIAIIILMWFMDPAFIAPLFNTTLGIFLLFVIVGLIAIGGLMIRKIVTIQV